jgi:hypothetical protein
MQLNNLAASAANLLEQFVEQLPNFGIDVPESQYVGSGIIAWDGESLTVTLGTVAQGFPGKPDDLTFVTATPTVTYATFYVQLLREASALSGGGFAQNMTPDAAQLGGEGLQAVSDAQALVQAAIAIHQTYTVEDPGLDFVVGPCQPLGPEGGLSAMRLTLGLALS